MTSLNITLALLTSSCLQIQLVLTPYNFNGPFRSWCWCIAAHHGPRRHSDKRAWARICSQKAGTNSKGKIQRPADGIRLDWLWHWLLALGGAAACHDALYSMHFTYFCNRIFCAITLPNFSANEFLDLLTNLCLCPQLGWDEAIVYCEIIQFVTVFLSTLRDDLTHRAGCAHNVIRQLLCLNVCSLFLSGFLV